MLFKIRITAQNMEWITLNKIKNNKHKSIKIGILVIIFLLILLIGYGWYKQEKSQDYWNNLWTFCSVLAIPVSIVAFILNEQSEKRGIIEKEEQDTRSKINNDCISSILELVFPNNKKEKNNYDKLIISSKALLLLSSIPDGEDKIKNEFENNIKDAARLIYDTTDKDNWKKIKENLTVLSGIMDNIETLTSKDDDTKIIKDPVIQENDLDTIVNKIKNIDVKNIDDKNILIVRASSGYSLGAWQMSESRAKNIKFIISVKGNQYSEKKLFEIIPVTDPCLDPNNNDRITFKKNYEYSKIEYKIKDIIKHYQKKNDGIIHTLSEWTSRNPILYYSKEFSDQLFNRLKEKK